MVVRVEGENCESVEGGSDIRGVGIGHGLLDWELVGNNGYLL